MLQVRRATKTATGGAKYDISDGPYCTCLVTVRKKTVLKKIMHLTPVLSYTVNSTHGMVLALHTFSQN